MIIPGAQNVSASENTCFFDPASVTRPLKIEEIQAIVQAFGTAAAACKRADEYGAQNFENKMRFVTEIYQACRSAVEESAEIIRYLDQLGVDAFDVDWGCYDAYEWVFPTCYLPDGRMMDISGTFAKSITQKPVLVAGAFTQ